MGSDAFAYKLRYFDRIGARMSALAEDGTPVVVGGDWNVAPEACDVHDPAACDGSICYHPDERAAWRLDHLIPAAARPGTKIVAEGKAGVSVTFEKDDARVPVILLNRRGEIHVQLIEVDNPFPGYHRGGGRMRRPPADVLRVVTEVSRIRVLAAELE